MKDTNEIEELLMQLPCSICINSEFVSKSRRYTNKYEYKYAILSIQKNSSEYIGRYAEPLDDTYGVHSYSHIFVKESTFLEMLKSLVQKVSVTTY